MKKVTLVSICMALLMSSYAQNGVENALTKLNDPKMKWWQDAKFGMFIHWGLYCIPAGKWGDRTDYGEWLMSDAKIPVDEYAGLAKQFNPTQFNAEEWVKLAKAAGQKYMVITAKHHEGFAMYKSNVSSFNIVDATPFKRDILKELAEACRKYDMKLGFYYSQAQDWHHKGGAVRDGNWDSAHVGDMQKYVDEIAIPQVKEILTNYGDVAVLWWDTPTGMTKEMCKQLGEALKPYPHLITNNRLGPGFGGDLETPEGFVPATGFPGKNWETCMAMNRHWGYCAADVSWATAPSLIHNLLDIVSKGGNFLLNVGPTSAGIIPEACQKDLLEMGKWLQVNGESVYGTKASPFPYLSWGRATLKGQTLYLHVFDWPADGQLNVPLGNKITNAYLLTDPKHKLMVRASNRSYTISLPASAPDTIASVIAVNFEGTPEVLTIPTTGKTVLVSSKDNTSKVEFITDGDPKTKWAAAKGEKEARLEIDLGVAYSITAMALAEPWRPWSRLKQEHTLEYFDGNNWKEVIKSTSRGTGSLDKFAPIKAQKFRLKLNNDKYPPSIEEWILYRNE